LVVLIQRKKGVLPKQGTRADSEWGGGKAFDQTGHGNTRGPEQ